MHFTNCGVRTLLHILDFYFCIAKYIHWVYLFNILNTGYRFLKANISPIDTQTTFTEHKKDGTINSTNNTTIIQNLLVNYIPSSSHMDINNSNYTDLVDLVILNSTL